MNKGGTQHVGDVDVTMVHAVHSSSLNNIDGDRPYVSDAAGLIVRLPEDSHCTIRAIPRSLGT